MSALDEASEKVEAFGDKIIWIVPGLSLPGLGSGGGCETCRGLRSRRSEFGADGGDSAGLGVLNGLNDLFHSVSINPSMLLKLYS